MYREAYEEGDCSERDTGLRQYIGRPSGYAEMYSFVFLPRLMTPLYERASHLSKTKQAISKNTISATDHRLTARIAPLPFSRTLPFCSVLKEAGA
jgi:hypothetical protein